MNRTMLAVAVAVTLVGCGSELETGGDLLKTQRSKTATVTYGLATTDRHDAGVSPTWSTSFGVRTTAAVYVATVVSGTLKGHHTQSVFVVAPNGSSYQRFDVRFATDVTAGPGEQQAEQTSTGWLVWVSLPVAGTLIEQYNLVGTWNAQTFVDASATPNAQGAFQLE